VNTMWRLLTVIAMSAGLVAIGDDQAKTGVKTIYTFEDAAPGKLPDKFVVAHSGGGKQGVWVVKEDEKGPDGKPTKVLAQTDADATDSRFPMCVAHEVKAKDVWVTVKFKAVSGNVDKAAGVVARYKDAGNYYIARANAEEGNVRVYKFEDGKRSRQLAGKNLEVTANQWHTLTLSVRGNKLSVGMDGQALFEATDDTFKDAGAAGVWTKADSVTHFDDLTIESFDAK
jgi:hypothetical protein